MAGDKGDGNGFDQPRLVSLNDVRRGRIVSFIFRAHAVQEGNGAGGGESGRYYGNREEVSHPLPAGADRRPVLTHLVTDFDLSPNVLRADVNARDGGWLVLGLTGDDARLQSALDWLRGQGLEVSEEA